MSHNNKNIVLIGMSGCGKSAIGKRLAKVLEMEFADTDSYIENKQGYSVKEIFDRHGEQYFRALEKEACKELSQTSKTVIATGGGVIKDPEAMAMLDSAFKVFITRDIGLILATADKNARPLFTDDDAVKELYAQREPLYVKYADVTVNNNSDMESCAWEIARLYISEQENNN